MHPTRGANANMSISSDDFNDACEWLHTQWQQRSKCDDWQDIRTLKHVSDIRHDSPTTVVADTDGQFGIKWLRIVRPTATKCAERRYTPQQNGADETVVDEEDDDEAISTSATKLVKPAVIYHIIHSQVYQVPVLFITFKDLPSTLPGLPLPEQVYEMLVAPSFRPQVDSVGPMGALSMTEHPITSTPAYFVHPCRTEDAMVAVAGGKDVSPKEYLLQWIGVIGQSVGLNVPFEVAQAIAPAIGVGGGA